MINYKTFILENFLKVIKDKAVRSQIKDLMQAGKPVEAYELMRKTKHDKPKVEWKPWESKHNHMYTGNPKDQ